MGAECFVVEGSGDGGVPQRTREKERERERERESERRETVYWRAAGTSMCEEKREKRGSKRYKTSCSAATNTFATSDVPVTTTATTVTTAITTTAIWACKRQ